MSIILVMLMSRNDSDFERSNFNFKENKTDGVDLSFNCLTTALKSTKKNSMVFGILFEHCLLILGITSRVDDCVGNIMFFKIF